MIRTYKDYKECLAADRQNMEIGNRNILIDLLRGNSDRVLLYLYVRAMRRFELICNACWGGKKSPIYLAYKIYFMWLRRHTGIYLMPNVFDKGFNLVHFGYVWIDEQAKIGKNCTLLPRVLLGKRRAGVTNPHILIGDNCYIGTGTTILGPIHIGNNVTIGAGSVVIHDIPDNCIVAGNPARIIKHNVLTNVKGGGKMKAFNLRFKAVA